MLDWLVEVFQHYPYLGVAAVFLACGLGLPLPEEIVLVSAGYICYVNERVELWMMMLVCAGAILAGDAIPFMLGRVFGPGLLKLRPFNVLVTRQRLARFDLFFRRYGDHVIFFSRFIAGIRVVSFFAAGTMRTSWPRFIALDGAGIVILVPILSSVGYHFGDTIDRAIASVKSIERGLLIAVVVVGVVVGATYWIRRRRRQRMLVGGPLETYVEPTTPVRDPDDEDGAEDEVQDGEPGEDRDEEPEDAGEP